MHTCFVTLLIKCELDEKDEHGALLNANSSAFSRNNRCERIERERVMQCFRINNTFCLYILIAVVKKNSGAFHRDLEYHRRKVGCLIPTKAICTLVNREMLIHPPRKSPLQLYFPSLLRLAITRRDNNYLFPSFGSGDY